MNKIVGFVVVLLVGALVGWAVWMEHEARAEADRRAATFETERNRAVAVADSARNAAMGAAVALRELEEQRQRERAAFEARIRRLTVRADSLANAIGPLMPPAEVSAEIREAVMAAVADLRANHAEQMDMVRGVLRTTEEELELALFVQGTFRIEADSLRSALASALEETKIWKRAANPGLWTRLTRDLPEKLVFAGLAVFAAAAVVGGG